MKRQKDFANSSYLQFWENHMHNKIVSKSHSTKL